VFLNFWVVCFQKPVSTTGVSVGKLRNLRWRPKWPPHATNFLTLVFFVQYLRVIHRFLGFAHEEFNENVIFTLSDVFSVIVNILLISVKKGLLYTHKVM